MAKFLLTYHGGSQPQTPAEQARSMDAWTAWLGQIGSALVDGGNPVGAAKTVKADGSVADGASNQATGYSIIQVPSFDEAVKASKMCPILESGGNVEIGQLLEVM